MSKLSQVQIDLLNNSLKRMEADAAYRVGEASMAAADSAANVNVDEAVLEDGEILTVPEIKDFDKYSFEQTINGNKAYGVLCISNLGVTKKLYTSTLRKSVIEYDDVTKTPVKNADGTRKAPVRSESKLSKAVRAAATIGDIYRLIAGKQIAFKKIGDITTSRIENRVVVGTRQTSVFEPNFVNK